MVKVRPSSPNFDAEEEAYDDPGVEGVHKQFAKRLGRCIAFMQIAWERHGTLLDKKTKKLWNSKTLHKRSRLLYLSHVHAHACIFNHYLMVIRCFLCTNASGRELTQKPAIASGISIWLHLPNVPAEVNCQKCFHNRRRTDSRRPCTSWCFRLTKVRSWTTATFAF